MIKNKINMDDGFNAELVETAFFDGIFEMPIINPPQKLVIPERLIPINHLNSSNNYSEAIAPYVYDDNFADIIKHPHDYVNLFKQFPALITLDNSVYVDSPLSVQIANVYRNRAIGHYFQKQGVNVITNVRWGDERSYTKCVFPECFAFAGAPKHSIVSVGTYGACQSQEEKYHMRNGMIAMLDILQPQTVLIYGPMSDFIFHGLYERTNFVQYSDWISSKKKRA